MGVRGEREKEIEREKKRRESKSTQEKGNDTIV